MQHRSVFNSAVIALALVIVFGGNISVSNLFASVAGNPSGSKPKADSGSITIMPVVEPGKNPSWFVLEQKPGTNFAGKILIKNLNTQKKLQTDLYVVDVNANEGSFVPQSRDDVKKDAKWITLEKQSAVLNPLQEMVVGMKGKIPADAVPGQHAMAIMAETVELNEQEATGGKKVSVSTRVGLRTYITVQGKVIPGGEVGGVNLAQENPYIFKIDFKNTGNSILKPSVETDIYNWRNQKVGSLPIMELYEIMPTGVAKIEVKWDYTKMGKYTLKFKVNYAGKSEMREASVIIYPPIHYVIAAVMVLLLIVANIFFMMRKKKAALAQAPMMAPAYATAPAGYNYAPQGYMPQGAPQQGYAPQQPQPMVQPMAPQPPRPVYAAPQQMQPGMQQPFPQQAQPQMAPAPQPPQPPQAPLPPQPPQQMQPPRQ